jgi:hypothetical protein
MLDKELIIIVDKTGLKAVEKSILEACDRVAMTPDAMLALEQAGLSYFTFDEVYDYRKFREDNLELTEATEDLLSELDKKYEDLLRYPRAFTGNILWFLVFFANTRYISSVCDWIKSNYGKVYLAASSEYDKPFEIELDFSEKGLAFYGFSRGLASKVGMIRETLSPECYWQDCAPGKLAVNKRQVIFSLGVAVKKALSKLSVTMKKWTENKKNTILVIQDKNEVGYLKKHLRMFAFKNPVEKMLQRVRHGHAAGQNIDPMFAEEVRDFSKRWFPAFAEHALEVFDLYHEKAIRHLRTFRDKVDHVFDIDEPKALFYSLSANRVYEDVYAYVANERDIPVFYFQHAGTTVFQEEDLYQRYLERNKNVRKINIYKSKLEKEILKEDHNSEKEVLGSAELYDLHLGQKNKRKKGILYCPGIFNAYNYKDLTANISDRQIFEINKDIVGVVSDFGADMDIKIHPCDTEHNHSYFSNLLDAKGCEGVNILKGFPAEKILKDYSLLILDYIGTTLVPDSIVFEMPVILYLKDMSILQEKALADLEKRFHIVRNRSDLEKYISRYAMGKLETKFSMEIVDKYAFPIDRGDPGVSISEFVQERINREVAA